MGSGFTEDAQRGIWLYCFALPLPHDISWRSTAAEGLGVLAKLLEVLPLPGGLLRSACDVYHAFASIFGHVLVRR